MVRGSQRDLLGKIGESRELVAKSALSNYEWTVKELGVEYNLEVIGQEGGHSVPRYVFTKNGSGSGIVPDFRLIWL